MGVEDAKKLVRESKKDEVDVMKVLDLVTSDLKGDIVGWPTIFILDHKGVIRHVDLHGEDLDQADQRSAS